MKYFSEKDKAIDFKKVDMETLEKLDRARGFAGVPFKITSNYRTPEHCIDIGSKPDSAHTEIPCTAFDIAAGSANSMYFIVKGLYEAGFTRIGLNVKNGHVHVDDSPNKPPYVLFIE
jgi:zinc D-Ala-D-Ala carboxypeptidase